MQVLWFLLLLGIGFLVFGAGLAVKYYGDDFGLVLDRSDLGLFNYWAKSNMHGWYRPMLMTFVAIVQSQFGLSTVPIHVTQVLLHVLTAFLVFRICSLLRLSPAQARISSLIFLISQADVLAVLSVDTFSVMGGTFFGLLALWLLVRNQVLLRGGWRPWVEGMGAVIAFMLSLFCKESSVAFLPLAGAILLLLPEVLESERIQWRLKWKQLIILLPFVLGTAAYLLLRSKAGSNPVSLGPGQYQFRLSFNIPLNVGLLVAAAAMPVSTAFAYEELISHHFLSLALALASALFSVGPLVYALTRRPRRWLWLTLAALGLMALFPMALLNHVSEQYVYGAMPFMAILMGAGWGEVLELTAKSSRLRSVALGGLAAMLALNALGIQSKARLMTQNGNLAESLLTQLAVVSRGVPAGGRLLLVNPPPARPSYSVYYINGFDVLEGRRNIVNHVSGRDDFSVKVAEAGNIPADFSAPDTLAVTLVEGKVVRYAAP